ncbi:MAG: response regulator [Burkholderiales bacterium]|nr:response regulator [Burkholderiales bacterium]
MNILHVEDQEDQFLLVEAAFEIAGIDARLIHVDSGEGSLAYLRKSGSYANAPTPDLVLLDLNMPRASGFDVLAARARDEALRRIPFVVLTSSANPADVRRAHELGCSSYVTKPLDLYELARAVKGIVDWLGAASLRVNGRPAGLP